MKFLFALLLINFFDSASALTKWEDLEEVAINPKYVHATDAKNRTEMKLIDLGNGKYRIDSFRVTPSSPLVLIYGGKKDLKDLCSDYYLYSHKTFKAKIVFSKNQEINYSNFVLDDGTRMSEELIENPILVSELKVNDLGQSDKTLWIEKTADKLKMGSDVNQFYVNLFNSQIKNESDRDVEIDLGHLNGLACDIGLGNIKPEITVNITLEKPLPVVNFWLKKDLFSEISTTFLSLTKNYPIKSDDNKALEKNQLILGWSIAMAEQLLRVEENSIMPKLIQSDSRRLDLLKAVEKNRAGESIDTSWRRTFEIEVPKVKTITRHLPFIQGNAEVLKAE